MFSADDYYCFKDAPEDIQEEIEKLGTENIIIDDCEDSHIEVCFGSYSECEININYELGEIKKQGEDSIYFTEDALMYAGIFSDNQVYECQLKRLMKRTALLSELYIEKAGLIATVGCNTILNNDLQILMNSASGFDSSSELYILSIKADEIDSMNKNNAGCRLW